MKNAIIQVLKIFKEAEKKVRIDQPQQPIVKPTQDYYDFMQDLRL